MPLVGLRHRVASGSTARIANGRTARLLSIAFLAVLALIAAACSGAAAGHPGFEPGYGPSGPPPGFFPLQPASQQGQYIYDFYPVIFWIAVAVFVLVEGLLLFIVLRYRRRPTDTELPKQTHGHSGLEIVWTIIPALIVLGLFAFTVDTLGKVETAQNPGDNPQLTIDVTGFQWQWTFEYKDQGVSLTGTGRDGPVMGIPVGEKVRIRLHAIDVIHSFYVPQFLYKKDVIPGRTNEFDVVVQPGRHLRRPMRRVLRHRPRRHALHRSGDDADRLRRLDRPATAAAARRRSALPAGRADRQRDLGRHHRRVQPGELTVAANTPWTVSLTNADASVPHNFSIHAANADGSDWDAPVNADPGGSAVYQPPPLKAGDYTFFCSLHPNMTGTLHVGP